MPKFKTVEAAEKWCRITYGCGLEQAICLNGGPVGKAGTLSAYYRTQKHAATVRGIPWHFSFPEWVMVWMSSGKWGERGRGRGKYCMARHGDAGPYAIGNVSIQLCTINSRDGLFKGLARKALAGASGVVHEGRA